MGIKSKLVVFDFETGGLDHTKHPAMELGLITIDQHTLEEELQYETLIAPYTGLFNEDLVYDPRAIEVHGIDPSRVEREGKPVEVVVDNLIKLFEKLKVPRDTRGLNKPILCGHNVMFDVGFLDYLFKKANKELSKYVLSNNGYIIAWDTQQMAGMLWNSKADDSKYNLGACCERAGLGNFLAHSALSDTKTTGELLKFFLRSFRNGGSESLAPPPEVSKVKKREKIESKHKVKFEF